MSDIGVEEEVIIIDIESDIADDSNMNAPPRGGTGGNPLDANGNDAAAVGGRKHGRQLLQLSDKRRLYQQECFQSCRPRLMLPRIKPWF